MCNTFMARPKAVALMDQGAVYKLTHSRNGWTESVIHSFGAPGDAYLASDCSFLTPAVTGRHHPCLAALIITAQFFNWYRRGLAGSRIF